MQGDTTKVCRQNTSLCLFQPLFLPSSSHPVTNVNGLFFRTLHLGHTTTGEHAYTM